MKAVDFLGKGGKRRKGVQTNVVIMLKSTEFSSPGGAIGQSRLDEALTRL